MSAIEQHHEVVTGLKPFIESRSTLLPVEKLWQPQKYLPNPSSSRFIDDVQELRREAAGLSAPLLVVLVGNTITEEALPTYPTLWTTISSVAGSSWIRTWTAEEHRHQIAMDRYLSLCGRVDTTALDLSVYDLINKGFDPGVAGDPYKGFMFTAFQEGATELSHKRTGRLAKIEGNSTLARLCGAIAGDENRHEMFYRSVAKEIFQQDPDGAVVAFKELLGKLMPMPASAMEGFDQFAAVAQKTGIYRARDYVTLLRDLVNYWGIPNLRISEGNKEAENAQKELSTKYTAKYGEKLDGFRNKAADNLGELSFSWIPNQIINLREVKVHPLLEGSSLPS